MLRSSLFFHFPRETCFVRGPWACVWILVWLPCVYAETPPEDSKPDPVLDETMFCAALNPLMDTAL